MYFRDAESRRSSHGATTVRPGRRAGRMTHIRGPLGDTVLTAPPAERAGVRGRPTSGQVGSDGVGQPVHLRPAHPRPVPRMARIAASRAGYPIH